MAAFAPYGLILVWSRRRGFPFPAWTAVAAAALLRAITVAGEPALSDDVHRYVWDGRVTLEGIDPYAHAPDDPALAHLRDDGWSRINNPSLETPYPPMAQGIFALVAAISPTPEAFKATAAIFDLLVVFLLLKLGARTDPRRGTWAALAYGLNPLACVESGMSGHLESAALAMALLALLLAGARFRRKGLATLSASAFLAASVATKLAPAIALSAMARKKPGMLLAVPLLAAAAFLPFFCSSGFGALSSPDAMARRWEGNGSAFPIFKAAAGAAIVGCTRADDPADIVHIPPLDVPARALQGTFFSLHKDGDHDPRRPGSFTVEDLSLGLAKIVAGLLLLAVLVFAWRRALPPSLAALWAFGALTLLTPILHPWYALWVISLASLRGAWPWLFLSFTLPLSYLPLDGWWAAGVWESPTWIPLVEYGVPLAAVVAYFVFSRSTARQDRKIQ